MPSGLLTLGAWETFIRADLLGDPDFGVSQHADPSCEVRVGQNDFDTVIDIWKYIDSMLQE